MPPFNLVINTERWANLGILDQSEGSLVLHINNNTIPGNAFHLPYLLVLLMIKTYQNDLLFPSVLYDTRFILWGFIYTDRCELRAADVSSLCNDEDIY